MPAQLEELTPAWHEIRAELRRVVGESAYELWLSSVEVKDWDGAFLLLQAPPSKQAWIAKRFGRIVESCVRGVIGGAVRVAFDTQTSARRSGARPLIPESKRAVTLNPRFSFDQFVIGEGNRLAHAAALAVAELPGQAYNPLFLHATPGLGKTHLLHAIGNYIIAFGNRAAVRFTTAEAFTNHFISALSTRSLDAFKHEYRDADVLLIDDIQFLASKAKTSEEFFHTFNVLYETGRQLVLTCDRLPHQLGDVEERLRARFESGLVADIQPPDFQTRLTILRKRAALDHVPLSDPRVLDLVAKRISDNVRALEGALIRIVAHHSLTGQPIDLALAETVLVGVQPPSRGRPLGVPDVQDLVGSYFGLSREQLLAPTRVMRVSWPRQLAIFLCRKFTGASLHEIGHQFGGRNHATVINAVKRVEEKLRVDPEALHAVESLSTQLREQQGDRAH